MILRLRAITHDCVTATLWYLLHSVNAIFHIYRNVLYSPEAVEMCKLPNGAFVLSTLLFDNSAIWYILFCLQSVFVLKVQHSCQGMLL